ncbi:mandelate racemase/muconate lactonizing enzyme family protein [Larkinella terrae]|uniref:Dipeptide epimerase n=1 Tax=Larkinella terrae TaxID=2025311 RepID=A0A7K0EUT8_9BACT|nr:dipeptide epimerase [Larkinella terrae]MRS65577.1 dipeptide epimerase [Larkinella terrae]
MKISHIDVFKFNIPLKAPISISLGTIESARNLLVRIHADGLIGWGEGSPFWMIVGETQETGYAAARDFAKLLIGQNALDIEGNLNRLDAYLPNNPTTKSAFDMALYDLAAQAAGMPLYAFLGGSKRTLVTDETIYLNSPERMADDAVRIKEKGGVAIKVKLGTNQRDDIRRVEVIRETVGDGIPIRTDANQGWDYVTALNVLTTIQNWNIEYCEQPVKAWNIADLKRLRRNTSVPIMADESLFNHRDALRLIQEDAVDYFNIKLSKSGGIFNAQKINALAEAAGIPCMIGCMSESRLAITAKAHFASSRRNVTFFDLDAPFEHAEDPVAGGAVYEGYVVELSDNPGIGAKIDPQFLESLENYTVR